MDSHVVLPGDEEVNSQVGWNLKCYLQGNGTWFYHPQLAFLHDEKFRVQFMVAIPGCQDHPNSLYGCHLWVPGSSQLPLWLPSMGAKIIPTPFMVAIYGCQGQAHSLYGGHLWLPGSIPFPLFYDARVALVL